MNTARRNTPGNTACDNVSTPRNTASDNISENKNKNENNEQETKTTTTKNEETKKTINNDKQQHKQQKQKQQEGVNLEAKPDCYRLGARPKTTVCSVPLPIASSFKANDVNDDLEPKVELVSVVSGQHRDEEDGRPTPEPAPNKVTYQKPKTFVATTSPVMSQLTPIRGKIQRGKVAELMGRFERGEIEVNEAGKDKVDLKRLKNIKDCLKTKKQRTPGQKEKLRKKNLNWTYQSLNSYS